MYKNYNIHDIQYIELINNRNTHLALLSDDKKNYIDITSNTAANSYHVKSYKVNNTRVICSLKKILFDNKLDILLIDGYGKKREEINGNYALDILSIYKKMLLLDEETKRQLMMISTLVSDICVRNIIKNTNYLNCSLLYEKIYEQLNNYVYIDLIKNGLGSHTLFLTKQDNMVDYKISRILKHLEIDIDIKEIPDFKIEYDLNNINYIDSNGLSKQVYCSNINENQKVKNCQYQKLKNS